MGYSCPVCSDPQADDIHLANHLAFTAIARGGDHEAWLDEHVPEWGGMDDEGLASALVEVAEETEYPQVFEDTTGRSPQGTDGRAHGQTHRTDEHRDDIATEQLPDGVDGFNEADVDEDTDDVLARARELTRKRREADE